MASPAGQFRPWRLITAFAILVVVLYGLVFGTKGSNSPKLGIDLQGGTQLTLTAHTVDGSVPSKTAMQQAQDILIKRVNASGVTGAQVQIDGNTTLTVTTPGNQDLSTLTNSARLNIRPQLAQGYDYDLVSAASTATSGTATSGAATTGAKTSSSVVAGEPGTSTKAATTSSAAPSPQGLRAAAAATTSATTGATTTSTTKSTAKSTTTTAPAASSGAVASSGAAATTAALKKTWPIAGSNPKNPDQPAATTAEGWAAWVTAAETAASNGTISCTDVNKAAGVDLPDLPLIACGTSANGGGVYVLDKTLIQGSEIKSAAAGLDTSSGAGWVVNLSFKSDGYKTWSSYTSTSANIGKQTAFTLDGEVISSPSIKQAITTVTTMISGSFTQATANDLANSLNFGALPLDFKQSASTTISAELGSQYLDAGLIAGGIGLLLVVLYCLVYYRLLGLITIGSLVLSGGLVYAIMVLLGRWIGLSLDLAGVAGLIVAIGITADSFVIYFERLKDEVREGRTFRSAVPRGWERAKRTILSADAVSFLSAVILYLVAVGDVKGFAFTLGLSTVLDLVVVYLVTHPLVALASGSKIFNSARFSGLGAVAAAGARQRAATARLTAKEA
ncbi:preprotein translocase subunit SecD [Nakamurella panacisegetis]|uniref:Protein translocase subunit SecD n=1 Tax=Nakamurella panacisegetis TaxID=1090615 RepID=A0A1H0QVG5_9ACTN|nr:protein translocase subunit SecD [Nakamurella panacisegetis]SDP21267.1 preprotein translocase subunit SecD [Nakamurella panacisegetis]